MGLFGGGESRKTAEKANARFARASSGWAQLLKTLRESEGQRILDIGPTSSGNINFLTGLGHSIYMSNIVGDALDAKWTRADEEQFPVDAFLDENLQFGDRKFDTVLLWDTADYLEPVLRQAVVQRLHDVLEPGGQLLSFFHIKPEDELQRYHLREDGQVDVQTVRPLPVRDVMNNRQVEQLFSSFSSYKFFLAKDNLREVLVTR